MPYGTSVLSSHILFSEYRGPRILNDATPAPAPTPTPAPTPEPKPNPEPAPKPNPEDDFKTRLTDLETKNKELKAKLKEKEDADKAAEEAKLKEAGEHQKLAEQYKTESVTEKAAREAAEARATKFESVMKKQLETQLAAITDKDKKEKITALLGDKPVEEQMEMLPNLLGLMGVAAASFGGPTPTSTTTPDKSDMAVKKARHAELVKKTKENTISGSERAELHRIGFELSAEFQKEQEAKKAN